jgi:hypothetical protein
MITVDRGESGRKDSVVRHLVEKGKGHGAGFK